MARVIEHVTVYREPGRFGGWPANGGIWSWGGSAGAELGEIVLGFSIGWMDYEKLSGHPIKGGPDSGPAQARSTDGGRTWVLNRHPFLSPGECPPVPCPGDIAFTHPDFALRFGCSGVHDGAESFFWISYDRCANWQGPYAFPMLGLKGIAARTDYQVYGPNDCLFFLTASKADGWEGRAFCARTTDGGKTFRFVSLIGPEPPYHGWTIMPSSLRLPGGRLLAALRSREPVGEDGTHQFIDLWASDDEGGTWRHLSTPAPDSEGGNPPSMVRLADGRIVITWAYRGTPHDLRASISTDDGETWEEVILRTGAGSGDIGYTRTRIRPDGKLVTAYYWNDPYESPDRPSDRYIAATIWEA